MKTKKHPKANLENYSKLFAQLGLVLALCVVYLLIQNKTFSKELVQLIDQGVTDEVSAEANIIYKIEPPKIQPKKKKVALQIVKKIENDDTTGETILSDIDPEEPVDLTEIVEEKIQETIIEDVPFIALEEAPVFPGCKGNKEEMKACFTKEIRKFVSRKFNNELAGTLNLATGTQRISVLFKIDATGKVVDVQARAPHKKLQAEAIRVVELLPQMKPGKQSGNPVNVKYALPIVFKIE